MTLVLGIVASLLTIAIGLWKFFWGRDAERKKKKEKAGNEIKDAIDSGDTSAITGGFDDLNRVRK